MAESIRKEDWERFRALGRVPPSIREVVLRSWVRSQRETSVETLKRAPVIGQHELRAIRNRNARLRRAAQSAIQQAGYMLNDSGAMMLLCDPGGIVMDAAGDSRILSRGEENHLHPGGRWDEGAIGTNAIGTALHVGKPVTITGVEHFCEAIQRWSCAAAPVRDPFSGEVLGAIDISGPSGESFRTVSALSVTLALQIEEGLRNASLHEHRLLIERLLAHRSSWAGDEVMLLDRYGREVWSSAMFGKMAAELVEGSAALTDIAARGQNDVSQIAARMRNALPECGVDIVGDQGEALGVIVTLCRSRRVSLRGSGGTITLDDIASGSPEIAALCARALKLVESGIPLLIEGGAGSGKETMARALHAAGPQAALPFEIVDCALLNADVLRSDIKMGMGIMRLAESGGTLCLDELADTPPEAQSALAQVLALLRREVGVPLQIITLSSASLAEKMAEGRLRRELHFRVAGAGLRLPGLAERGDEIAGLARRFAQDCIGSGQIRSGEAHSKAGKSVRSTPVRLTPAALIRLQAYDWPGNLRELRNLVESLSAISPSGLIDVADLPPEIARPTSSARRDETLREREKAEILNAVAEAGGNMTEAARRLGISRSTLYLKLDQYGVARSKRT